jgi:formate dehydrogenase maturation protein FdhE
MEMVSVCSLIKCNSCGNFGYEDNLRVSLHHNLNGTLSIQANCPECDAWVKWLTVNSDNLKLLSVEDLELFKKVKSFQKNVKGVYCVKCSKEYSLDETCVNLKKFSNGEYNIKVECKECDSFIKWLSQTSENIKLLSKADKITLKKYLENKTLEETRRNSFLDDTSCYSNGENFRK